MFAQHLAGAVVGAVADMPAAGARAGDPHLVGQAALVDLVGEHLLRHRRAADVARADERDVQGLRHRAPRAGRRPSTRAPARRRRRLVEVGAAVTPADDHGVDAVLGGALDVVGPVADHQHPVRQRVQLGERVRHHVGLGRANAVDAGAGDDLEMLVEPEVREDPVRGRLGLGRGHRQPHTGGAQVGQQLRDAVEQAVHRPAARGVVGAVGGDRGVGVVAEPHRAQRVVHRRADDAAGQVAVGNRRRRSHRAHGESWTRCPAPSRSGCRRGRRSPTAAGSPRRCHPVVVTRPLSPTAHYCRDVASRTRAAARYHGDQAAGPGMLDFAVNVRTDEPPVVAGRAACGAAARTWAATRARTTNSERCEAVAARHGRAADEVALLAGAAEGFALLANLRPPLAALIAPSFTEPEAALSAAGVALQPRRAGPAVRPGRRGRARRRRSRRGRQPDQSRPRCCTSASRSSRCAGPGRIVVVDEAFADAVPGEPECLAGRRAARRGGVAQPDQDLVAGRAAGRLRAGRPRRAATG